MDMTEEQKAEYKRRALAYQQNPLLMAAFPPRRCCEECGADLPPGRVSIVCRDCGPIVSSQHAYQDSKKDEAERKHRDWMDSCLRSVESWKPPVRYTTTAFETFDRKLQPQAFALASNVSTDGRGLLLTGPAGTGKTHLAAAIFHRHYAAWQREVTPRPAARFVRESDIFLRLRASFAPGASETEELILRDYQHCKILILDDLCKYEPGDSKFRNRIYWELIDSIYNDSHTVLVVTANNTIAELIAQLGSPIVDRLRDMCEVVVMTGRSQRGKS